MSECGAYRDTVDVLQRKFTKIVSKIDDIQMSKSAVRLSDQADLVEENTAQPSQHQNYSSTEQRSNQTFNSDFLLNGQAFNIQDLSSDIEEFKSNNNIPSPSEFKIEFSAKKQDIKNEINGRGA